MTAATTSTHGGDVTVYIASADTATCTELAVRTAVAHAGTPHRLVVGDSGSTDGSIEMLKRFRDRGWLDIEIAEDKRHHSEWLDLWVKTCATRWAVFVDSDVEFHRDNWLGDMVDVADRGGHGLVSAELLPAAPHTVEPVAQKVVYLAPRPAPWLLLVDCSAVRALGASFQFIAEPAPDRPEGTIAYDTGAKLFAALAESGVTWTAMPASFGSAYTHYGNMSWAQAHGPTIAHRMKVRRVQRRLRRARRRDGV